MEKAKHAISSDCERLVELFVCQESHDFAVFCEEWKKMLFQHMYSGLMRDVEIIQMTEHIFDAAKRMFFENDTPDDNNQRKRKIGILYLIYAIYFKQPTELFVKFKITLARWKALKEFIESIRSDPTTVQVRYIFYKLIAADAFRFVVTDNEWGFDSIFIRKQKTNRPKPTFFWSNAGKDITELNDPTVGFVESLKILEDGYNEMKKLMNEEPSTSKSSNAFWKLDTGSIMGEVKNSFDKIAKLLKPDADDEEKLPSGSKKDMPKPRKVQRIVDRRKNIRRKAFKTDKSGNVENPYDITLQGDMIQISRGDCRHRSKVQSVHAVFDQSLPKDTIQELVCEDTHGVDDSNSSKDNINMTMLPTL